MSGASVGQIVKEHLRGLRPPPKAETNGVPAKSILKLLAGLTFMQWITFFSGWLAWTCDATDFFSVSLSVSRLVVTFDRPTHKITQAITLTLLFRSVGALIFGLLSDRYGRKWPLVFCMYTIVVFQIGSSFCNTFQQFLACRSLFGVAMGGVWGLAASTALEVLPVELRGLASGVLQQGYAVGYLIAAVINLWLVPKSSHGWRSLFWVAAGISFSAGTFRMFLPESPLFLRAKADREEAARLAEERGETPPNQNKTKVFLNESKVMLKRHWKLCIYAVLLMTGFNFLSHGSQDLYPTYIEDDKLLSSNLATKATIIGNCGAVAGGTVAGLVSQRLGRRLTMMLFILSIGAFIPLWIIPSGFSALAAGAFCVQFGVQGAWGVIPIQLAEMSPPAFRATFPGLMYQLGNMVSSASSQIEATGGDHLRTTVKGKDVPDYAKVQGILLGTVAAFTFIVVMVGPEKLGSRFEKHALAFEDGAGEDAEIPDADLVDEQGRRIGTAGYGTGPRKGDIDVERRESARTSEEKVNEKGAPTEDVHIEKA